MAEWVEVEVEGEAAVAVAVEGSVVKGLGGAPRPF